MKNYRIPGFMLESVRVDFACDDEMVYVGEVFVDRMGVVLAM